MVNTLHIKVYSEYQDRWAGMPMQDKNSVLVPTDHLKALNSNLERLNYLLGALLNEQIETFKIEKEIKEQKAELSALAHKIRGK